MYLRDITGRLLAEVEHARLAALLDSAMDGIITVDDKQHIVMYNRAAEKIFGWPSGQALGQPLGEPIPERFRADHGEHIGRFSATGVTSRRMGEGSVICGLRASGEDFPMDASISQLDTADGKLYTVILRDGTEMPRKPQSLGLMGLHERAQLLNGNFSFNSAPRQSTRVGVTIPLPQEEAAR